MARRLQDGGRTQGNQHQERSKECSSQQQALQPETFSLTMKRPFPNRKQVIRAAIDRAACILFTLATVTSVLTASALPLVASDDSLGPSLVSVAIHGRVLKQVAQDEDARKNDVRTTILGAAVSGCQTTLTSTTLRLLPSNGCAQFEVVSRGFVTTDTVSNSPQATILGQGQHDFEIIKRVEFDGDRIRTWHPHGWITARETPRQVFSRFDGVPLIGALSNQIARNEVLRRHPQIQDAVAADVARDVLNEINSSVDARLSQLSGQLGQLQRQVADIGPAASLSWDARSTENSLELVGRSEVPSSGPVSRLARGAVQLNDDEDIVVVVSEGFATRLASHFVPKGLSMPDTQLMASLASGTEKILDINTIQTLRPSADSQASLFSITPRPEDPIRIRFDSGVIETIFHGRVEPRIGFPSDWMTTEFRFTGAYGSEDHWTLRTLPSDESEESGTTTTGTIWGNAVSTVSSSIADQVNGVGVSRWIPIELPNLPDQQAQLVQVDCRDGLLRAAFRLAPRESGP